MKNADNIASPCIDICDLDQTGQCCLGCGRSLDEIGAWSEASDSERRAIIEKLPERLRRLND